MVPGSSQRQASGIKLLLSDANTSCTVNSASFCLPPSSFSLGRLFRTFRLAFPCFRLDLHIFNAGATSVTSNLMAGPEIACNSKLKGALCDVFLLPCGERPVLNSMGTVCQGCKTLVARSTKKVGRKFIEDVLNATRQIWHRGYPLRRSWCG